MTVNAGLIKCRASSSRESYTAVFTLFYYLFVSGCEYLFSFFKILFCKFVPPVLVLLQEFLFAR